MFTQKGENSRTEGVPNPVLFYAGEFGYCFSNFSAFTVNWKGRVWQTSEHAFQAAGFDSEEIIEEIANAQSAHDALKIAIREQENMRSTWESEKRDVMKDICRHKLQQHEYIQKSLTQSGDVKLIEDSPVDACWGRGADWEGKNWLGEIWMELREETS